MRELEIEQKKKFIKLELIFRDGKIVHSREIKDKEWEK
jgi:hypothetical protein